MTEPLHLGLTPWLAPIGRGAAELALQATRAEAWGYHSFWLPENHFGDGAIPDPLMLLGAVAATTKTLRLATTSYLLPLRHPLQAAEQVAVLDQLSGGRVILGVGRGYQPALFDAFSVERAEKRAIFAECLAMMRAAWSGAPLESAGGVSVWPRPVQQPHPPIWVAAIGPKALAQAGSLGLPYLASPMEPLDALQRNYARHADACRAAGVATPDVVPIMRTVFVSRDETLLDEVRTALARQVDLLRAQSSGPLRGRLGEAVDSWAVVGTPTEVRDAIARYRDCLGMTHLVATRLRSADVDTGALETSLALLAEHAV